KWVAAWGAQKLYGMEGPDRRMMFGLTTAHTAVALAVVTIGYNMILPDGSRMMDETILNGTVLVILVTCAIAPLLAAEAAAKIKVRILNAIGPETAQEQAAETRRHRTLVGVANPITAASLVELAMLSRVSREGSSPDLMYALHVRNDNSPASRAMGRNALNLAQEAAAAAGATLETIERFDLNTVTGLLNTIEERGINEVVLGMHRKATVIDTFLGSKIEQLLRQTNRMVVVSRCYIPLNTVTRIVVFVPAKAEYETGFSRWTQTLCALAREIGCRIIFCCGSGQQRLIRGVIAAADIGVRHEYRLLESLDDFILLAGRVLDDDLMVVVGARSNSVSHSADMAEIPMILQQHCGRNNLLVVYPEQFGDETPVESFSDPLASDISSTPSPWLLRLRATFSRLSTLLLLRQRRHRKNKNALR
ncbi:MAG: universal stress protein, partial [Muribaculaceae bacterium]|nr:universal stress protein [Muribaculaceae bacterium]